MALSGAEPIGSMGSDTPIAVLSSRPRLVFDYFSQLFAQVTNPPLDAIREELVTSLSATIGPERNLLEPKPESCRQIVLEFPVIGNDDLAKLLYLNEHGETPGLSAFAIDGLYAVAGGGAALADAIEQVCDQVLAAIDSGANIIVLSDRHSGKELAPIPSLLLTAAVHHHLGRERARTRTGLVVETGEAREVHHMALLVGYGAAAVNPYLALDAVAEMAERGELGELSARHSGSQLHLRGRQRRVEGDVEDGDLDHRLVHRRAGLRSDRPRSRPRRSLLHRNVEPPRRRRPRRHRGRDLCSSPSRLGRTREPSSRTARSTSAATTSGAERVSTTSSTRAPSSNCQHATRARRYEIFKEYTTLVDDQAEHLATLRGLLVMRTGDEAVRPPVPLDEVEPVELDREAVRDRRHVLRLDLGRGARDARRCDEPARREVEHR